MEMTQPIMKPTIHHAETLMKKDAQKASTHAAVNTHTSSL